MAALMRRDPAELSRHEFDLLVVGGGIYGAWATLDAAQRGMRVALIERADFGGATSSNHHRIIHGGLRYLQHAHFRRMRQSIRERSTLLRIVPSLVRPLPVLVPTTRGIGQHRLALGGALAMNDLLSADRNRGLTPTHRLPRGRLVSHHEAESLAPGFDFRPYTGGAVFHDAQILSPERLILAIVQAAAAAGATVTNYLAAESYLRRGARVTGVRARDSLSGHEVEVRARLVLNCAGPWTDECVRRLAEGAPDDRLRVFKAVVLVTRDLGLRAALAVPGRAPHRERAEVLSKGFRNFFLTPWRGLTLVGTFYAPRVGPAETCVATEAEIDGWVAELNESWPGLDLGTDDVLDAYAGLLPRARGDSGPLEYAKRYEIIDHARENGIDGVLSVLGVKFTTARAIAAEAVDRAAGRLGRPLRVSRTDAPLPLDGPPLIEDAREAAAALRDDARALREAVRRAVREQMAQTLEDVILRRTELAVAGYPGDEVVSHCAAIACELLGWELPRIERETRLFRNRYPLGRCLHDA
jgi:glycerol-3-phosphate dehydrogenase